MKILLLLALVMAPTSAFAVHCNAVLVGRGYTAAKAYDLKAASYDENYLEVQVGQYLFAADLLNYKSNGSIRMFIHDYNTEVTSVNDGSFRKVGGNSTEVTLKQILRWGLDDQLSLILGCYE